MPAGPFTLSPLDGFDWMAVQWGAPDQPRTPTCSYCDADLRQDDDDAPIPLMLWNKEGWAAEFCEACQIKWWGMQPLEGTDTYDYD